MEGVELAKEKMKNEETSLKLEKLLVHLIDMDMNPWISMPQDITPTLD